MTKIVQWWKKFSFWMKLKGIFAALGIGGEVALFIGESSQGYKWFVAGATPIICNLPPHSDATRNGRVQTMNTFLDTQGWTLVDVASLLSTNNDGVTYEASLMADSIHPNTAGHLLIANAVLARL